MDPNQQRPGRPGLAPAAPRLPVPRRPAHEVLLAPGEVAALFGVDAKTVSRWEKTGRLTCIRTLGGHRRFSKTEVERLLARVDPRRQG